MKLIYCTKCGKKLPVYRKALPNFGRIIDLVEPHTCGEMVEEFDLSPINIPATVIPDKGNEFVQKLNGLSPTKANDIPDRRDLSNVEDKRKVKTTAPKSLLDQVKSFGNSNPEGNIDDLG